MPKEEAESEISKSSTSLLSRTPQTKRTSIIVEASKDRGISCRKIEFRARL
jgi:hypothetical protein